MKRACAPPPVAVDTKMEVFPSESVAESVIIVSAFDILVDSESDVVRDSTMVGIVVVITCTNKSCCS